MKSSTMIRATFLVLLSAVLIPAVSFAQGEYLWGSNSGFEIGGVVAGTQGVTIVAGAAGYSFKGVADIAVFYGREDFVGHYKLFGGIQGVAWILKEGRGHPPISLAVAGSFENHAIYKAYGVDLRCTKRIPFQGSRAFLLPSLSAGFAWGVREGYSYSFYMSVERHIYSATASVSVLVPFSSRTGLTATVYKTAANGADPTGGMLSLVIGQFGKE
jgi:hypothetical protein